ncbi:hypothetical protein [Microbulbifer aggregans]|uniref:hypothetical protein n=1 Tax=Microbulbifer aggregans TaxID=1769779 RepID=UPI001CFD645A|nr:hypothetical protein [Microbulbifer aggregans]
MNTFKIRSLALAGLLSAVSAPGMAQGGLWGGDEANPSMTIAPAQLKIDVPMPVSSGNLQLMLAQATNGGGLADLKQEAVRKYTQYLHSEFGRELDEMLEDEDVPLVSEDGVLNLQNNLQLKVIKHLGGMAPRGSYDLEKGTIQLTGEFSYTLSNRTGSALREQSIDLEELKIKTKYLVRTPHDGSAADDNTEEAIKKALSEMVEELVERMEESLDAEHLRVLAAL